MRRGEGATPQMRAAQILEMLIQYAILDGAWRTGEHFTVADPVRGTREMSPDEVIDDYGGRIAEMATGVIERSTATTRVVSVPVGREEGAVPYVLDVEDRFAEYPKYWPA